MFKNITKEEDDYLLLLEKKPELENVLDKATNNDTFVKVISSLNSEEIDYLNKILFDSEIREQFGIVASYDFVNLVKEHGYIEILNILKNFSENFYEGSGDRFEKVKTVFDYMDYLLYYDDIMKFSSKDISNESIETIISLKKEIDENELSELHKEIEKAKNEIKDLATEKEEIISTKNTTLEEIESLKNTVETLNSELSELKNQIDNKRYILTTNLSEEMNAERIKILSQLYTEISAERTKANADISTLNEERNELLLKLQQLESMLDYYGIPSSVNDMISSYPFNKVEVVWEPINKNHELYLQNYYTIEQYVAAKKLEYEKKTWKSKEEIDNDFMINSPLLDLFVSKVKDFSNSKTNASTSISNIIEYENWNDNGKHDVNVLISILKQLKLPKYINKENINSIWKDNLEQYIALLDAKANIASSEVDKRVAEAKLNYFIEMVKPYIPSDIKLEIPSTEEQYSLSKVK